MKIALVTDQHFGARNDSSVFHDYFEKFYRDVFIPYLDENNITTVIDLGDTFDRRKYVNFYSLSRAKEYYYDQLYARSIELYTIVGNHCIPYRNTLSVNSPDLLLREYDNNTTIAEPTELNFDGCDILLVPWICDDNYKQTMDLIESTTAQIAFGHLELSGFEMHKGMVQEDGMSASVFSKFDLVASGHFHHKSTRGNINYLGCPYEMTWSDFEDQKGFHVFDTETRELTFIPNPFRMFYKLFYDDTTFTLTDLKQNMFPSEIVNTNVKVVVKKKTNPYWFDMYIDQLEKLGVVSIQVVDDNLNLNLENDDEIIDEAEDTLTIVRKYVEVSGLVQGNDQVKLQSLMQSLYEEAMDVE